MCGPEDLIRDLGVRVGHGAARSRMRSVELKRRLDARIGDSIQGGGVVSPIWGEFAVGRKAEADPRATEWRRVRVGSGRRSPEEPQARPRKGAVGVGLVGVHELSRMGTVAAAPGASGPVTRIVPCSQKGAQCEVFADDALQPGGDALRRLLGGRWGSEQPISVEYRVRPASVQRKRSRGTERPRSACSTIHGSRSDRARETRASLDNRGLDKC